ncbi:hypothetical protein [Bacillus mycoides]
MKIEFKVKFEISGLNGIWEKLFMLIGEAVLQTIVQVLIQTYLGQ